MPTAHPLQQLYDREINFKIETFWDDGFSVALGDIDSGYKATGTVHTFDEAVTWLLEHASIHFPDMPNEGLLDESAPQ